MDSQVNLSHLSEEECQQILSVIQRDFSLRQQEKDRLEELQAEIKEEKLRSEILSKGRAFNENCCVRCFAQFYMFFNPKVQCVSCKFNVCKKCSVYNSKQKETMCSMCKKQEELDTLSNSWFYSNVAEKFDRFGSADVVRSIHKRKTESDVDSDSGYHPPLSSTFEPNGKHRTSALFRPTVEEPLTTGNDREESVFTHLRERLDGIEKSVKQLHLQENRTEQQKQFYDNSVKQNIDSVQTLLMTVTKQLASNINSGDSDDSRSERNERVNREQQETIAKQLLQNAIQQLYSSQSMMFSVNNGDPFAFIDPAALTLDAYTKRLSEAIINKINEDHHQSQRQLEDQVEEEEEEVEEEEVVNKRKLGAIPLNSDSEIVTTDSMSDVDVRDRVSIWREKSMAMNLSRSESQSLTSLNQSQNEMEIPSSFIESEILTEKLAALNQSEMSNVINQSSTDTQANPVISNQSDSDRRLTSASSESDAETRTSETLNQSKVETPEAVTPCDEQLEDDFAITTNVSDIKFDISEYEVTTDSILSLAMRKREFPVLPSLDSDEGGFAIKSSDSDLDLTKDHEADRSYGPWTLGINRRIPMTPHGSFRSIRSSDRSRNESPVIFLPRHLQIETAFIGDISASELSETDSLSVTDGGSDTDEDAVKPSDIVMQTDNTASAKRRSRTVSQTDDGRSKPKPSIDSFVQTDDDTSDVIRELSTENAKLSKDSCVQAEENSTKTDEGSRADSAIGSSSFDFPDSGQDLEPIFTETPQDVVVCCGQSFKCKATLDGRRPIDVFWFHDTLRLDFDERCTVAHKGRVFSMEVVESTLADDGHYVCIAFNEHGRCCHQFTVSIIDPENFRKAGASRGFKVLTSGKREKPIPTSEYLSKERSQIATSTLLISPSAVSPDATSHSITSPAAIPLTTISHDDVSKCDLSPDTMPKTSTAVACQPSEMLPLDAVSPPDVSPSDKSTDGISSAAESPCEVPLDAKSPVCRQELLHSAPTPVAQSRLTTPGLDKTLDTVHTREDAHRTLPAQNQLPLHVPREKECLHLDEVSAAKSYQSACMTDDWLLQSDCEDARAGDGKVELVLSFPEFERLYKARFMTPEQLKSGRFTPEEVERIQKILSTHQEMDEDTQTGNQQRKDEKLATFDFSYKDPSLKAQFYGRDYLVKDSVELLAGKQGTSTKTKPSHQVSATSSVSLSSPRNSDNAVEFHHAANSDVMRKNVSRRESSSARRDHPESSTTKDHPELPTVSDHRKSTSAPKGHLDSSSVGVHQCEQPSSESLGVTKSATHPPSEAEDKADGKMLEGDASMTKTATDLEELNLPSVRSLRLLFNSHPASGDETAFTRNYSLTARDLPNSVIAQQNLAKKTKKARLSLVSEPSGED